MSETSSRSRSRSPERDGNNAPADKKQDNAPVGGAEEQVKLYVGNLDYGKILFWIEETERETENRIPFFQFPFQFNHFFT